MHQPFKEYAVISKDDGSFQFDGCERSNFIEGIRYGVGERGTFTTTAILSDTVKIIPDSLGTRLVFTYQGQNFAVAATSIAKLISILRAKGARIEVDREALATTFCMGNLQIPRLPIKGGVLAPINSLVSLSKGRVHFEPFRDVSIALVSNEALTDRIAEELCENMLRGIEGSERILLEATGGLDSRVSMAVALHLGLQDRIDFVTRGGYNHPDRICAERIAHAYDFDFVATPYDVQDVSLEEFEGNGRFCAGVRWMDDVSFRLNRKIEGFTVVTGGTGEVMRSFYGGEYVSKLGKGNEFFNQRLTDEVAAEHIRTFAPKTNFLAKGIDFAPAVTQEMKRHGETLGEAILNQYAMFRNRIHFGAATSRRWKYFRSIDPLYSPAGYELAKRMDTEYQVSGELQFTLIDKLFPALNTFPLAGKSVPAKFAERAKEAKFYRGRKSLKKRPTMPSQNKFGASTEPVRDIIAEYVDRAAEKGIGSELFDMDKVKSFLASPKPGAAQSLRKAIVSPLMFLSLAQA